MFCARSWGFVNILMQIWMFFTVIYFSVLCCDLVPYYSFIVVYQGLRVCGSRVHVLFCVVLWKEIFEYIYYKIQENSKGNTVICYLSNHIWRKYIFYSSDHFWPKNLTWKRSVSRWRKIFIIKKKYFPQRNVMFD